MWRGDTCGEGVEGQSVRLEQQRPWAAAGGLRGDVGVSAEIRCLVCPRGPLWQDERGISAKAEVSEEPKGGHGGFP